MYAGHLDFRAPLVWTVDDALPATTCDDYVKRMLGGSAEVAPIVGRDGPEIDLDVRNNTRVMWDDVDEARTLLGRVTDSVPKTFLDQRLRGANPRLRLYRYRANEQHAAHWDTEVELEDGIRSRITLVFYLNDSFDGGATDFPELERRIEPRAGRALLFQHRVLHAALPVTRGEKHVLRTDILYGP